MLELFVKIFAPAQKASDWWLPYLPTFTALLLGAATLWLVGVRQDKQLLHERERDRKSFDFKRKFELDSKLREQYAHWYAVGYSALDKAYDSMHSHHDAEGHAEATSVKIREFETQTSLLRLHEQDRDMAREVRESLDVVISVCNSDTRTNEWDIPRHQEIYVAAEEARGIERTPRQYATSALDSVITARAQLFDL